MILNNKMYYMNTETNQTYDNQILFTDKNNQNDKDISSINLYTSRKDILENNSNTKNKNILQNFTNEKICI
jgi:hypothetical protein